MRRDPAAPELASPWLDTETAARHLGREPGTLRGWRSLGKGPAFRLVGGRYVRYHVGDLDAFASGCGLASPAVKPPLDGAEK